MLKTQFTKAIYLCLFCFITSSFVPGTDADLMVSLPGVPSTISLSDESAGTAAPMAGAVIPVAAKMQSGEAFMAPKVKLNKQALQFANHYIKTSAEDLVSISKRSKAPFTIMDSVFSRYGLPIELKYLAVIESELKTSALSRVGALGPWQLMPSTAHDLGLRITRQYDERTSYTKSTKAAALYLRDLYTQFGDWLLVLAAYNAGPKPVYTAIQKSGSRNFWALQNYLPAETRGHVKRFIATHYYFEGQGSVTTLTKSENIAYNKSVSAFALAHSTQVLAKQKETNWAIAVMISDITGMTGLSYKVPSKKEETKESQDDQFKRIMKESEKTLQKANKAMEDVARRA